ncbi:hypothetical protein RSOLAG22IIIB_08736 [Rhizoctonia solani]|uniref:Uncharacterized protein n=1 Tax=Rhizoctonia solani TaxID=456999 RepID=A0A0K6FV84_9AGAM|nr:hypothetical protein RSOLAG22IIIB_08736 [Rhizoctonia solani]
MPYHRSYARNTRNLYTPDEMAVVMSSIPQLSQWTGTFRDILDVVQGISSVKSTHAEFIVYLQDVLILLEGGQYSFNDRNIERVHNLKIAEKNNSTISQKAARRHPKAGDQ